MTLRDRLSRLTIRQAEKLLGPQGPKLIILGGKYEIDIDAQVEWSSNVFRLRLAEAFASIVEDDHAVNKMRFFCSSCDGVCEHIGAAFSLILEEKTALGLAVPPPEDETPIDLTEEELVKRELARRRDRAATERLALKPLENGVLWGDYTITSRESGKSYRIALRGWERGESYCSCPDFRKNTLGTCKHILYALSRAKTKFTETERRKPFKPSRIAIHLVYGHDIELRLQTPPNLDPSTKRLLQPFIGASISDIAGLARVVQTCAGKSIDITIYPDAEEYMHRELHHAKVASLVAQIRKAPDRHPLRSTLLKVELLPYQLDGIAFAVGTGRAVLADDMGLGKTIQGIGAAELLARECSITRTLIVCPASVKGQWRNEINRFSDRQAQIVVGTGRERADCYRTPVFFTICNYEQVLRDLQSIEKVAWDFIILDEGQRIKNWEAKTSRVIKALRSRYALVLSGTPLENRLEELYSVVEFIDDRRLGPDFRFASQYRIESSNGRITGYKNLDTLREILKPVLLRRTRGAVMKQLPPRTTEIVRVTPTAEQLDIHITNHNIVAMIVKKAYLTEMDLLRLQKALLLCRMVADSTYLVNKQEPDFSTKLERLAELLPQLAAEKERKILVFSEWTTMLDLIEKRILQKNGLRWVRLDGSIPQKKRQTLVNQFQSDPDCTFFITTNAGATGLNLQAANTVVNIDLPWNPAVLEQRIGRAHRMGQKRPVQVYLMVTTETIEENMLQTLAAKKDLSIAALDIESDVTKIDLRSGIDELKRRLELLLGEKPTAPEDVSERQRVEAQAQALAQRQKIEEAGGTLITAAISFMGAMLPTAGLPPPAPEAVALIRNGLSSCMEPTADGGYRLQLKLPDANALESMAKALAAFTAIAGR
jgi:superfamily II DNA or RNA helicase